MTIFPLSPTAGALVLLALAAGPLAAQDSPVAPETVATGPAADCATLQVLADGAPKAQKALTLAEQGLATNGNVISAYNDLGAAIEDSLDDVGYQTSCYIPVLAAIKETATPDLDGVSPAIVSDSVISSWANQCEAMTDPAGVSTCLTDVTGARADDMLTEGQTITLVNALPLDKVAFDEAQMTELLTLVKEQVEAGTLSTSQQGTIVDELLNQ